MRELDLEDRVGVPSSDGGWRAAKGETETTTVDLLNPDELVPITSLGINNPDVAVVLSVEYDRSTQWRPNYARDLQITQWTLMVCLPPGAMFEIVLTPLSLAPVLPLPTCPSSYHPLSCLDSRDASTCLHVSYSLSQGKPYHPIYIDAVATVVSNLRDMHNGLGVVSTLVDVSKFWSSYAVPSSTSPDPVLCEHQFTPLRFSLLIADRPGAVPTLSSVIS